MSDENGNDLVSWEPNLSDEALQHFARLEREIAPQISFVRAVRSVLGLSQNGLADIIGVTQSAISKLEMRDDASFGVLAKAARAQDLRLRLIVETEDGEEKANLLVPAGS